MSRFLEPHHFPVTSPNSCSAEGNMKSRKGKDKDKEFQTRRGAEVCKAFQACYQNHQKLYMKKQFELGPDPPSLLMPQAANCSYPAIIPKIHFITACLRGGQDFTYFKGYNSVSKYLNNLTLDFGNIKVQQKTIFNRHDVKVTHHCMKI